MARFCFKSIFHSNLKPAYFPGKTILPGVFLGIGWNPGSWDKVVKYSGQYDVSSSDKSYLSLYAAVGGGF